VSADDKAKDILRNVIGASITAAQSATQAAQDFVADKSPQIRQQSRNAKMIGQFVVRMGASKAGEIVGNAKRRLETETPVQDSPITQQEQESTPSAEPILNYSVLSAPQIIALLPTLNSAEIASIQAYEALNRNRRTVLSAIQAHLEG
jgi:hypothetical protein